MKNSRYIIFNQNETKGQIEAAQSDMTQVEQTIANYFLNNEELTDFSSKRISALLYVSEATLSRFAKKCGFKGYREFIFAYEKDLKEEKNGTVSEKDISLFTKKVQSSYQKLLQENFKLLDENQIRRIAGLLNVSRRVFVYGMGSSGNVAEEFQLRFMRIGLDVTAVTDSQMIQMSAALVEERMLVIAISLSGTTREIVESIRIAKSRNAKVIFITANPAPETAARCDEVLRVAYLKNLDTGTKISPQFSILVMIDILYSYYFANDSYFKAQKYKETLSAIQGKHKGAMEDAEKGEDPE